MLLELILPMLSHTLRNRAFVVICTIQLDFNILHKAHDVGWLWESSTLVYIWMLKKLFWTSLNQFLGSFHNMQPIVVAVYSNQAEKPDWTIEARSFSLLSPLSPQTLDHIPAAVIMPVKLFITHWLSLLLTPPNSGTTTPPMVSILSICTESCVSIKLLFIVPPLWFALVPDILLHPFPLYF